MTLTTLTKQEGVSITLRAMSNPVQPIPVHEKPLRNHVTVQILMMIMMLMLMPMPMPTPPRPCSSPKARHK